ncbi:uncharacterized protein FIBRA_08692 [Fibroporia radiculosa]|uniref:Uncharacterized protein n=1 Tax=Fibroporia radiculosa TaxID=599839 RepID=J4ICH7_9APHY|nr:uncharacterized protein FIBRA_08692 [Fibroporia radiculosa]CCM06431.1 predicted protein [Fibroporia radiculosa]
MDSIFDLEWPDLGLPSLELEMENIGQSINFDSGKPFEPVTLPELINSVSASSATTPIILQTPIVALEPAALPEDLEGNLALERERQLLEEDVLPSSKIPDVGLFSRLPTYVPYSWLPPPFVPRAKSTAGRQPTGPSIPASASTSSERQVSSVSSVVPASSMPLNTPGMEPLEMVLRSTNSSPLLSHPQRTMQYPAPSWVGYTNILGLSGQTGWFSRSHVGSSAPVAVPTTPSILLEPHPLQSPASNVVSAGIAPPTVPPVTAEESLTPGCYTRCLGPPPEDAESSTRRGTKNKRESAGDEENDRAKRTCLAEPDEDESDDPPISCLWRKGCNFSGTPVKLGQHIMSVHMPGSRPDVVIVRSSDQVTCGLQGAEEEPCTFRSGIQDTLAHIREVHTEQQVGQLRTTYEVGPLESGGHSVDVPDLRVAAEAGHGSEEETYTQVCAEFHEAP